MKKYALKLTGIVFAVFFVIAAININTSGLLSLPDSAVISYDDLKIINEQKIFGSFVNAELHDKEINVGNEKQTKTKLCFKLFGFLPIKEVTVQVSEENEVFVGGIPLGFALKTSGLIVVGENTVLTADGSKQTAKTKSIKSGDIITKINDEKVLRPEDIPEILSKNNGGRITVTLMRNNDVFTCDVVPELDASTNEYKLGLWVKNQASGVGTLTYVDGETKRYGALGHAITDFETGIKIPVEEGKIYNCSLIGINKAQTGKPGELKCLFMQGNNHKGTVEKNTNMGVFGTVNNDDLTDINKTAKVGSRMSVKPGKAKIVSSVSGVREEYDIEIIKASYQSKSNDKSMVIRVTDPRLLKLTGGIVQGMSGSPILQNGKIVGAVTHVFISDSTKGYGIYIDWMIEN